MHMPRKLTSEEIEAQKDFMYERTVKLIARKDIDSITLDDILEEVQMAKGSFYKYYPSKEIFLYEVIKKNERIYSEKMFEAAQMKQNDLEAAFETLTDIIMDKKFLFRYTLPKDTEFLLRKLPAEYRKREEEKSKNNFLGLCRAMNITPTEEFFGAISYLMGALQVIVASPGEFGEIGRKKAVSIMIQAIYGLFTMEIEENGENK
jgi:AcrR family transcriptional regulator